MSSHYKLESTRPSERLGAQSIASLGQGMTSFYFHPCLTLLTNHYYIRYTEADDRQSSRLPPHQT